MKVLLTVVVLATAIFSQGALARKRGCEAQYSVNKGATYSSFIELGEVGGNKKKNCFEKAFNNLKANMAKAGVVYPAVVADHCEGKQGIEVYVQIDVEGKRNEGVEKKRIYAKCQYRNGDCIKYDQVVTGANWP